MERLEQAALPASEQAADPVVRVRLDLAYLGTAFHGWARQPRLRTVQGEIEEGLATLLRKPVALTVAGRTDSGVHAAAQVANFDVEQSRIAKLNREGDFEAGMVALKGRLNGLLSRASEAAGADVVVKSVRVVSADFDARFSALKRHYCYRISDRVETNDPLAAATMWWTGAQLDVSVMQAEAVCLLGEHDFLSFCKPREGATTIRTLEKVRVERSSTGIEVYLSADAFCHSMVRSVVGALVEVGRGRRPRGWLKQLVEQPSRSHSVPIAPAHGLTLVAVEYPGKDEWADQQKRTRRFRSLDC